MKGAAGFRTSCYGEVHSCCTRSLDRWNKSEEEIWQGGWTFPSCMAGHYFGAVTIHAVIGQSIGRGLMSFTDPRIKAAVMFRPNSPRQGVNPKEAFRKVKLPSMLMTGTKDVALIGDADLKVSSGSVSLARHLVVNTRWFFTEPSTPPLATTPFLATPRRGIRIIIGSYSPNFGLLGCLAKREMPLSVMK